MKDKTIGFALTGSFCTFKNVIQELEILSKTGVTILPIMSTNAYSTDTRFGSAESFVKKIESICGRSVIHTIHVCLTDITTKPLSLSG